MSEVFETMTKSKVGIYTVRIWRHVDVFTFFDFDCTLLVEDIKAREPEQIFEKLKEIPNISGCEITNAAGMGGVWYKDWP